MAGVVAVVGVTKEVVHLVKEISDDLPAIVSNLRSTVTEVTRGVDAAINKIDDLKHAKVKLSYRAKYACQ